MLIRENENFRFIARRKARKKIVIVLLSIVLVLSSIGCGNNGKAEEPVKSVLETNAVDANEDIVDDGEQAKATVKDENSTEKADQSLQTIPNSDLPMYPNSELVYSDDETLIYASNDSARDVYDFYEENADFTTLQNIMGFYLLGTPLYEMINNQDFEDGDERRAVINKHIDDAGGMAVRTFEILDKDWDKEHLLTFFENEGDAPLDKTVILYEFINEFTGR